MYNQRAKRTSTPASPGGTQFFQHFPSNYLRPYGLADPEPDHEKLQKRINPINCEWLKRPQTGMSEFAATVVDNMNWLASNPSRFINKEFWNEIKNNCEPFLDALANLNTKNAEAMPHHHHVNAVLENFYDDSSPIHDAMAEMFQVGGAIYAMSIQYLMARDLMCHPEEYADKMVGTDRIITDFKKERSVPALLEMLSSACVPKSQQRQQSSG